MLIVFPANAETGKVTLSGDSGGTVGVELNIPIGKKYDYNDILVTKVIDGNRLRLENGERLLLIGIDCPERFVNPKAKQDRQRTGLDLKTITAMGEKAALFVKKLVEGKRVRLEFDVQQRDDDGRLWAYVWIKIPMRKYIYNKDTGQPIEEISEYQRFLNQDIIEAGYAEPLTVPPNIKYAELFKKLYYQAKDNNQGLWK